VSDRELVQTLVLPFDALRTLANGGAEVRLYRNSVTRSLQVGKRTDTLGKEGLRALAEAKLLQRISHAHLVPVLDVARVPDCEVAPMQVIELIMPYYPRGSACDAMFQRGERFTIGEAVRLTGQALRGLGELHEVEGILHRDVKSANVFLTDDGDLRVGDLGACCPLVAGSAEPYASLQPSTPPETYTCSRIGRSYDIFGVGLLLHELLNGPLRYPYDLEQNRKRLARGMVAVPDRDLLFLPHIPRRLRAIVRRAMHRDPLKRYQATAEMTAALAVAPYIDWMQESVDQDNVQWEGSLASQRDRSFRVNATRRHVHRGKPSAWILSGCQRVSAWRRFVDDRIVPTLDGGEATEFFDQVLSAALSA
jgi:serine/threonine protein kinase